MKLHAIIMLYEYLHFFAHIYVNQKTVVYVACHLTDLGWRDISEFLHRMTIRYTSSLEETISETTFYCDGIERT